MTEADVVMSYKMHAKRNLGLRGSRLIGSPIEIGSQINYPCHGMLIALVFLHPLLPLCSNSRDPSRAAGRGGWTLDGAGVAGVSTPECCIRVWGCGGLTVIVPSFVPDPLSLCHLKCQDVSRGGYRLPLYLRVRERGPPRCVRLAPDSSCLSACSWAPLPLAYPSCATYVPRQDLRPGLRRHPGCLHQG